MTKAIHYAREGGRGEVSSYATADHFRDVTKMIAYGKGGSCDLNEEAAQ